MNESTATNDDEQTASGFSEREAMRQRAEELRAEGRSGRKKADDLQAVLHIVTHHLKSTEQLEIDQDRRGRTMDALYHQRWIDS